MEDNSPPNNQLVKRNQNPAKWELVEPREINLPPEYYGSAFEAEPVVDGKKQILKFLAPLRNHWLFITIVISLLTLAAIFWEAQKPEFYKAVARVQVDNEINPVTGTKGNSVVLNSSNDPAYFITQLQILKGSGLMRRVVKSLDLENNKDFISPQKGRQLNAWQNVLRMFNLYQPPPVKRTDPAENITENKVAAKTENAPGSDADIERYAPLVSRLQAGLKIEPVKDTKSGVTTRLIEIEYTHPDPVIAAKVVNAIADSYVLQNLENKAQANEAAGDFLQKRVAELQSQIRAGEERLINYGKNNQILSLDSTQNTVVQRLSALNTSLAEAEDARISAEAAFRAALKNPMTDAAAESKDSRTTAIETQLSTLRQNLNQLKTEYTDDWPEVIKVKRQIETLEKELEENRKRASGTQIAGLEQKYREALARERELRNNFEKQRSEVLEQNEAAINYRIIQQEIETNKTLLEGLLQRSKEIDVVLNGTPNNVHVVDRGLIPRFPSGGGAATNIIIAVFASFLIGAILSSIYDWLNDTVKSKEDLEEEIGMSLLGLIPAVNPKFGSELLFRLLPNRLLSFRNRRQGKNVYDLEGFKKPVIVESYLHLRTCLLLSTAGGAPQTILITSGQPGEGKTVTALNLAKSLAESGARVLLIDADLRYPRLHIINQLDNSAGLTNLLTSKGINQFIINQAIQKESSSGLDILTGGSNTPNPVNLLASEEMINLLEVLKTQYDHIVLDSPPALYFSDSVILATYVDAVTLVARYNFSTHQIIREAKKCLANVNAKIIGLVLNGIPLKSTDYYHEHYYYNLENPPLKEGKGVLGIS